MINVTNPFLPPFDEYQKYMEAVWSNHWLTNHGPLASQYEEELSKSFETDRLWYVTNGTIALQLAYKALGLTGEVITTPFSFIATASSLFWEGLDPVFCDIDQATFNLDPNKLEALITNRTSAIVATHVYGNPCDIDRIELIASKFGLKVIYDAAHCFGVKFKGRSVFQYGDLSTLSLHATKILHSVEGGVVFSSNADLHQKLWDLRNFGFDGPERIRSLGINGKNSEFHAAMGLSIIKYQKEILNKYEQLYLNYRKGLSAIERIEYQQIHEDATYNYAYFPMLVESEELVIELKSYLESKGVNTSRYFYPSLNKVDYLEKNACPVAENIASRVLCLPMNYYLEEKDQAMILKSIKEFYKQ